jgi:hypothetical protein
MAAPLGRAVGNAAKANPRLYSTSSATVLSHQQPPPMPVMSNIMDDFGPRNPFAVNIESLAFLMSKLASTLKSTNLSLIHPITVEATMHTRPTVLVEPLSAGSVSLATMASKELAFVKKKTSVANITLPPTFEGEHGWRYSEDASHSRSKTYSYPGLDMWDHILKNEENSLETNMPLSSRLLEILDRWRMANSNAKLYLYDIANTFGVYNRVEKSIDDFVHPEHGSNDHRSWIARYLLNLPQEEGLQRQMALIRLPSNRTLDGNSKMSSYEYVNVPATPESEQARFAQNVTHFISNLAKSFKFW